MNALEKWATLLNPTWGEAYAWQLRTSAVDTTLTAPVGAGDTRIRVASVADFAVGDVVTVGAGDSEESRTITIVGTGRSPARISR